MNSRVTDSRNRLGQRHRAGTARRVQPGDKQRWTRAASLMDRIATVRPADFIIGLLAASASAMNQSPKSSTAPYAGNKKTLQRQRRHGVQHPQQGAGASLGAEI